MRVCWGHKVRATLIAAVIVFAGLGVYQRFADEPDAVLVGTVTKVIDGDTIDVQLESGPIRVRFRPDTRA